jgi:ABC-type oligopeptide transport system ATPase subunit
LDSLYTQDYLEHNKDKYTTKLSQMKLKLDKLRIKEEQINNEIQKNYKHIEKNVDVLFKKEIDEFKISEDSLTDYHI